jgi:GNAT superfamily N-acetyltransferase
MELALKKIREILVDTDPYYSDLLNLLKNQMYDIGAVESIEKISASVKNALKPESRAKFFLLYETDQQPIGLLFFNVCSGIESGGDYIWLNEIQIIKSHRGLGMGKYFLQFLINWAKENEIKYISTMTSPQNIHSQNIFKSNGFDISDSKWMELTI